MTVLHVLAIYWHEWNDGPYPSDYITMKSVVDKVNLTIEAFNLETGGKAALKLQQSGQRVRIGKSRFFIWEAFREGEKKDMMHLTDNIRCNVVRKVVKGLQTVWLHLKLHNLIDSGLPPQRQNLGCSLLTVLPIFFVSRHTL